MATSRTGDVAWDSGVVVSNSTFSVYAGSPLAADQQYTISLETAVIVPSVGAASVASRCAAALETVLSTGLMPAAALSASAAAASKGAQLQVLTSGLWDGAEWIGGAGPDWALTESWRGNYLKSAPWHLDAVPSSASAFVAGIGYHELWCNGKRQGLPEAKNQPG